MRMLRGFRTCLSILCFGRFLAAPCLSYCDGLPIENGKFSGLARVVPRMRLEANRKRMSRNSIIIANVPKKGPGPSLRILCRRGLVICIVLSIMGTVNKKLVWPAMLIAVFALSRWPGLMPPNFSAAYAIVFCAGLYLPGRMGWIIPLCVLAGSDLLISLFFYSHGDFSPSLFLLGQAPSYLAYAGLIGLGRAFGAKRPWGLLTMGGLIGAVLFYIVTNTASWLSLPYAKTLAGWLQAVTTGLPGYPPTWVFFRNTLLSGGLFTGLFVGAMKMTESSETAEEREKEESTPEPAAEPVKAEP
jgi:hypothetical protein